MRGQEYTRERMASRQAGRQVVGRMGWEELHVSLVNEGHCELLKSSSDNTHSMAYVERGNVPFRFISLMWSIPSRCLEGDSCAILFHCK